jgi:hypothetical protein
MPYTSNFFYNASDKYEAEHNFKKLLLSKGIDRKVNYADPSRYWMDYVIIEKFRMLLPLKHWPPRFKLRKTSIVAKYEKNLYIFCAELADSYAIMFYVMFLKSDLSDEELIMLQLTV